ncbi:hypothetical protein [Microbulbifer sp. VAAF005]|uniref:hypothetical protein n=1 Tax=Microbulbifer sp. VAAF005 TaxID=3034230 RepID=UPI0024AE274A|nr:hypothetical protein [Microbulbifer sp. VAAF005]WHI48968.1 hypothetical protein P0078_11630 [Microbulbifer sp. VAAF005]
MTNIKRFLPTKKFHILPIKGLTPAELKSSAKAAYRDREKLGHSSLLNFLAKQFGISGGFAGFLHEYETSLKPFMLQHELLRHTDLLTPRKQPKFDIPYLKLSIEQVCGRLFDSGLALPKRLFTGYNFDYRSHYVDPGREFLQYTDAHGGYHDFDSEILLRFVKNAETQPNPLQNEKPQIDIVVGGLLAHCIQPSFNLMGDLLVYPASDSLTQPEIYWPLKACREDKARRIELIERVGKLFRSQFEAGDEGWVEVIPYNESLVFLKGTKGEYDFVIPGLRSIPFEHQIYAPYLKRADIPSQMNEEYHFRRWHYFEYRGWRERDAHRAEQFFYSSGGDISCYPGYSGVLSTYMASHKKYTPGKVRHSSSSSAVKFYRVQLDCKVLYVSDLISIDEITLFSNRNVDYFRYRDSIKECTKPDDLIPMNDDCTLLPAAVTWYDACAYMAHFESVNNLPVRLLKTSEYLTIRQQCDPDASNYLKTEHPGGYRKSKPDGLLEFSDRSGLSYGAHPPYMKVERFDKLMCHYAKPLEYIIHPSGLQFVDSDSFGEWLYENPNGNYAAAVRSKSLLSMFGTNHLDHDLFPAYSTGKYKHAKIGFRLCYLSSK